MFGFGLNNGGLGLALRTGGGADLTFAFTFNGEPFTFGDVAFTYGAAS